MSPGANAQNWGLAEALQHLLRVSGQLRPNIIGDIGHARGERMVCVDACKTTPRTLNIKFKQHEHHVAFYSVTGRVAPSS